MANMLSPGVQSRENDLTAVTPAVSNSAGGFAGVFQWGPVMQPTVVASEDELVAKFWKPNDATATSFFSAANFLAYSRNLTVVRADTQGSRNAVQTKTGSVSTIAVTDAGADYVTAVVTIAAPATAGGVTAEAEAVVVGGKIDSIVVTKPGSGYTTAPVVTITDSEGTGAGAAATATVLTAGIKIQNDDAYETQWANGSGLTGVFAARYPGKLGNSLRVIVVDKATWADWVLTSEGKNYRNEFSREPDTARELHILVIDALGRFTSNAGAVLEKFAFVSKANNDRYVDGTSSYYKNVINNTSQYLRWTDHPADSDLGLTGADWGTESSPTAVFKDLVAALAFTLGGGEDDFAATDADYINAFMELRNPDQYDISLVPTGWVNATVAQHVIDNLVLARKDCMAFVSPRDTTTGEPIVGKTTDTARRIVAYANQLNRNTSYAVMDTGVKYQYDRYNDVYRWIPLNADIAGLCARTDYTNDPWFSPGGFNRGQIKNVVRLGFSPDETARDILYQRGINPVVSFRGEGTVLYGDKTLQITPNSAFDRINVRRLFITLQKAISRAAKAQLFELNDEFTRAQFRGMIEPYLRDVQGRRGIIDFKVVCDATNNTGEVIDTNRFVASIYVKPARSINFVTLDFVAVRSAVSFNEVGAV